MFAEKAAENDTYFQEAVVTFKRLYKSANDGFSRIEALLGLGNLYYNRKQIEEAANWYDKAALEGTVPLDVHRKRGEIWEELKELEKAKEGYRNFLKNVIDVNMRKKIELKLKALTDA